MIWTRGRNDAGADPSTAIRGLFTTHCFTEISFTAPDDARFRVGMERLDPWPTNVPMLPGLRMFTFSASD